MANINLLEGEKDLHHNRGGNVKTPYLVERTIDIAKLVAKKGSALVSGDIVQAIRIPAQTYVLAAFAGSGKLVDSTTLTLGISGGFGITSYDVFGEDRIVAGSTPRLIGGEGTSDSEEVVNVTLTFTGTLTEGSVRVSLLMLDVSPAVRGELAKYDNQASKLQTHSEL